MDYILVWLEIRAPAVHFLRNGTSPNKLSIPIEDIIEKATAIQIILDHRLLAGTESIVGPITVE